MNSRSLFGFCLLAMLLMCSTAMFADVADSGANGFTLKISVNVKAKPADVYRNILNIGQWWESSHTYSGDSHNLTIEERGGGCWCEKLASGSVKHMDVVLLLAPQLIRFRGGLGPLQGMAVDGALTFEIASDKAGGTNLVVTYAVGGYSSGGFTQIAGGVDHVLTEQIMRLKRVIETGSPEAKK